MLHKQVYLVRFITYLFQYIGSMNTALGEKVSVFFNIWKLNLNTKGMPKSTFLIVSLLLILSIISGAVAATYKCIDENGDVGYSQLPCKQNQKTDKMLKSGKKYVETEDCKYAGAFSKMVFSYMRSGLSAQELFDRYGGVNSISQGTLGVINYVYSFKFSTDVQRSRVAQLTIARCNAQAFGKVLCEDFPKEFQKIIFSCDEKERKEAIRLQKLIDQSVVQKWRFDNSATIGAYRAKGYENRNTEIMEIQEKNRKEKELKRIIECKRGYESKIKKIDDRMSQGYTVSLGEILRNKRRSLVKNLARDCR